jgi:DNA-binding FadR family transcriptional regulator
MTQAASADERAAIDNDFHLRLALAARNPVILLIVDGLANVLRRVLARRRALVASIPEAAQRQDAAHPPIVEAIRARDPERAAVAMDEHFRVTDELLARTSSLLVAPPAIASHAHTPRRP